MGSILPQTIFFGSKRNASDAELTVLSHTQKVCASVGSVACSCCGKPYLQVLHLLDQLHQVLAISNMEDLIKRAKEGVSQQAGTVSC